MAKMVFEVLGVSEERVDELCNQYFSEDGQFSDTLVESIRDSNLTENEKMVLLFAAGFLSALDFTKAPETIIKKNDYVH